jgi:hypothetical protein
MPIFPVDDPEWCTATKKLRTQWPLAMFRKASLDIGGDTSVEGFIVGLDNID